MKAIPLSRGLTAFVSDADFPLVAGHTWHAKPVLRARGGFYATRKVGNQTVYMHRIILGATKGQLVDHVDGDGLNNVRSNLRLTNASGNMASRGRLRNKTGLRGVEKRNRPNSNSFRALASAGDLNWRGPYRQSAIEAAIDYDRKAVELWGEFARPNFPCVVLPSANPRLFA